MDTDSADLRKHISQQFNVELEDLRNRVLTMGGLVHQQIRDATDALASGDTRLAERVIATEAQIDAMELSIDEECSQIIALRQPAASDLRLILAVIKAITDLERMGDKAERIAVIALELADHGRPRNQHDEIQAMARNVLVMLREALDAFARMDIEAAYKVTRDDRVVDRQYESITRQQLTFMLEDPRTISRALELMRVARALERIGDHSGNVCEYVIYLVKGKHIRHASPQEVERLIRPEK
ncbi:MAG: phosphate signaling complex protein PhoU [Pseudomonadales bacterium]